MRASCCTSLRTATLIIGFVNTVVYLAMLGYWTVFLVRDGLEVKHQKDQHLPNATKEKAKDMLVGIGVSTFPAAPIWICVVFIIYSVAAIILNVYLIFGASDEKRNHIKKWLVSSAFVNGCMGLCTVGQIIVFVVNSQTNFALAWMTSLLAGFILYIYTVMVVRSFLKMLQEEDKVLIVNNQRLRQSVTSEESL